MKQQGLTVNTSLQIVAGNKCNPKVPRQRWKTSEFFREHVFSKLLSEQANCILRKKKKPKVLEKQNKTKENDLL